MDRATRSETEEEWDRYPLEVPRGWDSRFHMLRNNWSQLGYQGLTTKSYEQGRKKYMPNCSKHVLAANSKLSTGEMRRAFQLEKEMEENENLHAYRAERNNSVLLATPTICNYERPTFSVEVKCDRGVKHESFACGCSQMPQDYSAQTFPQQLSREGVKDWNGMGNMSLKVSTNSCINKNVDCVCSDVSRPEVAVTKEPKCPCAASEQKFAAQCSYHSADSSLSSCERKDQVYDNIFSENKRLSRVSEVKDERKTNTNICKVLKICCKSNKADGSVKIKRQDERPICQCKESNNFKLSSTKCSEEKIKTMTEHRTSAEIRNLSIRDEDKKLQELEENKSMNECALKTQHEQEVPLESSKNCGSTNSKTITITCPADRYTIDASVRQNATNGRKYNVCSLIKRQKEEKLENTTATTSSGSSTKMEMKPTACSPDNIDLEQLIVKFFIPLQENK